MSRLSVDYEQTIREVAEKLKIKYFEEQQQLLTRHESQINQMTKQFEAEKEGLNNSLTKKGEEIAEVYNKASKEAEEQKKSSKLATEQALQEQKKLFQEMIDQVNYYVFLLNKNLSTLTLNGILTLKSSFLIIILNNI